MEGVFVARADVRNQLLYHAVDAALAVERNRSHHISQLRTPSFRLSCASVRALHCQPPPPAAVTGAGGHGGHAGAMAGTEAMVTVDVDTGMAMAADKGDGDEGGG